MGAKRQERKARQRAARATQPAGSIELAESAPGALAERPVVVTETTTRAALEAATDVAGGATKRRVTIIEAGWGSSGYYSKEVLARDGAKAWPAGTHMYLNHPGQFEDSDRPERNVADLVGVLLTDPVMEGNALVAEAEVFAHWTPMINEVADHIGVSIRAMGEMEWGEAEGRKGVIIKSLDEGISVDYVTKAGAKGKVGPLIESARAQSTNLEEARNAGSWFEASIHREFTLVADSMFGNGYLTREERIALSSAIGDGLDAFRESLEAAAPGLYERDPYADPDSAGASVSERAVEETATSNKEDGMSDEDKKALADLQETVKTLEGKVETLETEKAEESTRADRAEDALLRTRAEKVVAEATFIPDGSEKEVSVFEGLPERARKRAQEATLEGDLPTTEDGKLNESQLKERAIKAAKAEREYLREAGATVRVTGMGGSEPLNEAATTESTEKGQKELTESFQRLGLDENAAKVAAGGR